MPRRTGVDSTDQMRRCPECGGTGMVPDPRRPEIATMCPLCGGVGRLMGEGNRAALSRYRKQQAASIRSANRTRLASEQNDQERKRGAASRSLRRARKKPE